MSVRIDPDANTALTTAELDTRISFLEKSQILEVDLTDIQLETSADANALYDRIEKRIADSGEDQWFFLINYFNARIDPGAWFAYSRRGKSLNMAHSMGTVRFDTSDATRAQIRRDAGTEAFDPNLFADRDGALARLREFPSTRVERIIHTPNHTVEDLRARVRFLDADQIMDFDFTGLILHHSRDVTDLYDVLEDMAGATGRKWYFLINYDGCRIMPGAWVEYAARGKRLNESWSLGSVRYAPGSETETDIRLRAETGGFRPNIRNTRAEALERIDEMKRGAG
jgi:hypothetical protein